MLIRYYYLYIVYVVVRLSQTFQIILGSANLLLMKPLQPIRPIPLKLCRPVELPLKPPPLPLDQRWPRGSLTAPRITNLKVQLQIPQKLKTKKKVCKTPLRKKCPKEILLHHTLPLVLLQQRKKGLRRLRTFGMTSQSSSPQASLLTITWKRSTRLCKLILKLPIHQTRCG